MGTVVFFYPPKIPAHYFLCRANNEHLHLFNGENVFARKRIAAEHGIKFGFFNIRPRPERFIEQDDFSKDRLTISRVETTLSPLRFPSEDEQLRMINRFYRDKVEVQTLEVSWPVKNSVKGVKFTGEDEQLKDFRPLSLSESKYFLGAHNPPEKGVKFTGEEQIKLSLKSRPFFYPIANAGFFHINIVPAWM